MLKKKVLCVLTSALQFAKRKSPELCLIGGIASIIGGVVAAVIGTIKAVDAIDKFHEDMRLLNETIDKANKVSPETYPEAKQKEDKRIIYTHAIVTMAKLALPAVILVALGIFGVTKSYMILNTRNVGLAALAAAEAKQLATYRQRVEEMVGADKERDIFYGAKNETVEEKVVGDNGVETTVYKEHRSVDRDSDILSVFVDETMPGIYVKNDPISTKWNLKILQDQANKVLETNKTTFTLNQARRMMKLPETPEGMVWGWKYDPNVVNKINFFSFLDGETEADRRFANNLEDIVLIKFNVDCREVDGVKVPVNLYEDAMADRLIKKYATT